MLFYANRSLTNYKFYDFIFVGSKSFVQVQHQTSFLALAEEDVELWIFPIGSYSLLGAYAWRNEHEDCNDKQMFIPNKAFILSSNNTET